VLVNPKNPNAVDARTFEAAGRTLGVEIVIVNASTEPEIKEAFNRAVEQHADALLIHIDALFNDGAGQSQIIALAGQHRLPFYASLFSSLSTASAECPTFFTASESRSFDTLNLSAQY
jgi:hypothetical protein